MCVCVCVCVVCMCSMPVEAGGARGRLQRPPPGSFNKLLKQVVTR